MLSKILFKQHSSRCHLKVWTFQNYSTVVPDVKAKKLDPTASEMSSSYISELQREWLKAKPFKSLPGPTKFQMFRGFLKGGDFHGKPTDELMEICRKRYGDIYLLPGLFGQNTNLISFNLDDYEKIFRTEGQYPARPGFEVVTYYRLSKKDGLYDEHNLGAAGDGSEWGKFRSAVNPVLMQPRNAVLYIDPTQKVNEDFVRRIRLIRNPSTLEVPEDFLTEIKHLAFESVAVIALDKHMGLIRKGPQSVEALEIFKNVEIFNKSFYDLGIKPSIYKYIKTPTYKRFEKATDSLTNFCRKYVREALQRAEKKGPTAEARSVLEKLVKVDSKLAEVVAIDMLIVGVDTTSSALSAALLSIATNPEKQEKLRQEILTKIGKTDKFTTENMKNLPYLRACIKEALRIYPVTFGNIRSTGTELCMSGYQIPRGTNVFLASNRLLQEERYFPKPKEFLPERWLRSSFEDEISVKNIDPFIFLPFGFGPRSCVGKRIVDLELEITLANIVRNFKVEYNYSFENAFSIYFINTCVIPMKFKFTDLN